jgi:hypothetical protein
LIKPPLFSPKKNKLAAGTESEEEPPQMTDLTKWEKIIVVNIEMV